MTEKEKKDLFNEIFNQIDPSQLENLADDVKFLKNYCLELKEKNEIFSRYTKFQKEKLFEIKKVVDICNNSISKESNSILMIFDDGDIRKKFIENHKEEINLNTDYLTIQEVLAKKFNYKNYYSFTFYK